MSAEIMPNNASRTAWKTFAHRARVSPICFPIVQSLGRNRVTSRHSNLTCRYSPLTPWTAVRRAYGDRTMVVGGCSTGRLPTFNQNLPMWLTPSTSCNPHAIDFNVHIRRFPPLDFPHNTDIFSGLSLSCSSRLRS
jgi:hypothetical protein